MKLLRIELRKEKRSGVVPVMLLVGVFGALYGIANFVVRGDDLLRLPLPAMDILLTQLYGVIMILNMFGLVVAACLICNIEFRGNAIKKLYTLPTSISGFYLCKFLILTVLLAVAILVQNIVMALVGLNTLPAGDFSWPALLGFATYSFVTSMPVLAVMLLVAFRFENMWVPLGIGVGGFLSGMALASANSPILMVHPFVVMLKPAVAMSSNVDGTVTVIALAETLILLIAGVVIAKKTQAE